MRERTRSKGVSCIDKGGATTKWTYWTEMANVVPEKKLRLWDALYEALKKYYANLQQRAKVNLLSSDRL